MNITPKPMVVEAKVSDKAIVKINITSSIVFNQSFSDSISIIKQLSPNVAENTSSSISLNKTASLVSVIVDDKVTSDIVFVKKIYNILVDCFKKNFRMSGRTLVRNIVLGQGD